MTFDAAPVSPVCLVLASVAAYIPFIPIQSAFPWKPLCLSMGAFVPFAGSPCTSVKEQLPSEDTHVHLRSSSASSLSFCLLPCWATMSHCNLYLQQAGLANRPQVCAKHVSSLQTHLFRNLCLPHINLQKTAHWVFLKQY